MKQSWGLLNLPLALFVPLLAFLGMSHLISLMWLEDVNLLLLLPVLAIYCSSLPNPGHFKPEEASNT